MARSSLYKGIGRRLVIAALLAAPALAQTPGKVVSEKIEWTWTDRPEHPDDGLPNILLLGDSITRAYYPGTLSQLSGKANVYLFATSCSSGDPRLDEQLHSYFAMMGVQFAIVHFNNGMHGWGYSDAEFAGGLPGMIETIRENAPKAKLIWTTTTPLRKDPMDFGATNARIELRNELAAKIMSGEHIAVDDQHALMLQHQELHSDDIHFTGEGSAIQARQVAAKILEVMRK